MNHIRLLNGTNMYLPNLEVIRNKITNHSKEEPFKDTLPVVTNHRVDIEEFKGALYEAISKVDEIFKASPLVVVSSGYPNLEPSTG